MTEKELIEELGKAKSHLNQERNDISFLEAINKYHDENLVSSYLAYMLDQEHDVLNQIVRLDDPSFPGFKEVEIKLEVFAGEFGRIDILVDGVSENGKKTILVIENKIDSYEHGHQCRNYEEFISIAYPGYDRHFVFLYPEYQNINGLSSSLFRKLTYSELYEIIENYGSDSIFCLDFLKLIKNQFKDREMDNLDLTLASNYRVLKERLRSIDNKVDEVFKEFATKYSNHSHLENELVDMHRTLRFYDGSKWWSGYLDNDDKYYFYIEIKTLDRDSLDFVTQLTIHSYSSNSNTRLNRFISNELKRNYLDKFVILENRLFKTDKEFLSSSWKDDLTSFAFETLDGFKTKMNAIVDRFLAYK